MKNLERGRKAALLTCLAALGIAALVATAGRRHIAAWLDPPPDPRRELVTLDLRLDEKGLVRCETRPYLRADGTWLDLYEFSRDPDSTGAGVLPDLRGIEAYLSFRKRDRTPIFGEPGRLAVLVNYHREVPWELVSTIVDLCERAGIEKIDLDQDD